MERHVYSVVLVLLTVSVLSLAPAYALNETMIGDYGIVGHSGMQEIYGQYVQSKSYARLRTADDYDPGYLEDFWGWHLRSDADVTNSQGAVSASSQTPSPVGAWMQYGGMSFDVEEPAASAWTNTQSIYSPGTNESVDIELYYSASFNFLAGLDGDMKIYFGIWRNDISAGNLMLDEKDGWTIADLDFEGQTYRLLERGFSSDYESNTQWSLSLEAGNDYRFFTYMVGEVVPEPATLLLLAAGTCLLRQKK